MFTRIIDDANRRIEIGGRSAVGRWRVVRAAKAAFDARRTKFTFHTLLPEGQKRPTSIR